MTVSFVIPFHNEEKNCLLMLGKVLDFSKKHKLNFEIIAVDDKSVDQTSSILKKIAQRNKLIRPIFRKIDGLEEGNTMGTALLAGTREASGNIIIWTMGDLADDPNTYLAIIKKIEDGFDLVFGSRYMPGGSRGNLDPLKAYLSSSGTRLARLFFRIPVHDITNAFRGFKKELLTKVKLEESGFSISPEFAIKAHKIGFKLGEVPTVYTNRIEGVSSFKLYRMIKSYLRLYLKLWFRLILQPCLFKFRKTIFRNRLADFFH